MGSVPFRTVLMRTVLVRTVLFRTVLLLLLLTVLLLTFADCSVATCSFPVGMGNAAPVNNYGWPCIEGVRRQVLSTFAVWDAPSEQV
jgi:hypothetical protein